MIKIVPGEWRARYPRLFDEMHRLRRSAFHDRLRWRASIVNAWDIDGYDALNPLYVFSIGAQGLVAGAVRLLPTAGFTMLNDTFAELLPEGRRIAGPTIWEASRFVLLTTGQPRRDARVVGRTIAELGCAMSKIGVACGLSHIVAVYEAPTHALLNLCGLAGEPLGPPVDIDGVRSHAVFYEIGGAWDAKARRIAGDPDIPLDPAIVQFVRTRSDG